MINIKNIYYMLAYAYQVLNEKGYVQFSSEKFENIHSLLAAILAKGLSLQVKKGLAKKYIENEEPLMSVRGKIKISDTIKSSFNSKRIVCAFDEFSDNITINKILKSTAILLLKSGDVEKETKKSLKKSLIFFGNVQEIDLKAVRWNDIRYDRNNASYKMLINICYLLAKGLLISEETGKMKFADIFDEQRMNRLYEKFILEYYKRHHPALRPAALRIKWNTDDGFIDFLPQMNSDITLCFMEKELIIDAKYYKHSMQTGRFNKKTVHSNNLYQIYTYVKNKDIEKSGNVSGMLLYAKTDEEISPDYDYKLDKNSISVKNLDLNTEFELIASQLDNIAYKWAPELAEYEKAVKERV